MTCPSCGAANEPNRKFCGECGTKLAVPCPACGATNGPAVRFCGECGTRLGSTEAPAATAAGPAAPGDQLPSSRVSAPGQMERRVVTVLFADLVGFTARSEGRDPEQVRDFLARYFDVARDVVERYGGVVEKFIGDAVMAVWGARSALEDDAERAVRAALDLVESVRVLGRQAGEETLSLRAGVLTGEAAVNVGAVDQALVAGDLVNTASRLQSVAPPGAVLAGESTVRLADRAIAFEAAGEQVLKGKASPVPAWRALRVVAERGGLGRSEGIEAPFVGRDDELRLLKDLLHATSRERRVRIVSITGQAGVGKSRLAWEFLKYIDGVLEVVYWHQGRSPSFGEGVTFWALGEMVRRRAKLAEGDDDATTRRRIAETLAEYVPDPDERRQLEPQLLSLLGVGEAPGGREELFPALRIFFERVSIHGTTLLLFEDLQWADSGVLDFIDHLLEWSIGYPILIVTLARPELLERRPGWGAGRRDFVALSLGPLAEAPMRELLAGLAPDLPEATVRAILGRADGVPLYAVEMIRMLVSDGHLVDEGGVYRVVGDLGDLRVPDTLQSLIASRLDGLDPADRGMLQDAAVLGQTFGIDALAAINGEPTDVLETRLRTLVQREVLQLDTDPRSPERGQFGFTQALVREVAYATLSKRDRRSKHLAAARFFESLGDEEVAGVLATHYVDAWAAAPDGPEGEAVAGQARIALRAAAERASGLGSHEQAVAMLQRAREVTTDPVEEAELLQRIGTAHWYMGHYEAAIATLREAVVIARQRNDRIAMVRATALLGSSLVGAQRPQEAEAVLRPAVEEFEDLGENAAMAALWTAFGRSVMDSDPRASMRYLDRALEVAERLDLVPVIADAVITKGSLLAFTGRWREGTGLLEVGRRLAAAHGLAFQVGRAANNLTGALIDNEPERAVEVGREGIASLRRYGIKGLLVGALANTIEASLSLGQWDWVDAELAALRLEDMEGVDRDALLTGLVEIEAIRGRDVSAPVAALEEGLEESLDPAFRSAAELAIAIAAAAAGRRAEAHAYAVMAAERASINGPGGFSLATSMAILQRDAALATKTLDRLLEIGARGAALDADILRYRAGIAALEGRWGDAAVAYQDAWRRLSDLGLAFSLARAKLECYVVAPDGDRLAEGAVAEARSAFESIGAMAYVAQVDRAVVERAQAAPARTEGATTPVG